MKRGLLIFATLIFAAAVDDPLDPAREAFVKNEYKKAISLAEPHTAKSPQPAWRVIGAAHCFLKDAERARDVYGKLDDQGKAFLRYVCSRNTITLP
jgi:hypothetical protein